MGIDVSILRPMDLLLSFLHGTFYYLAILIKGQMQSSLIIVLIEIHFKRLG